MSIIQDTDNFLALLDAVGGGGGEYPYSNAWYGSEVFSAVLEWRKGSSPFTGQLLPSLRGNIKESAVLDVALGQNNPAINSVFGSIHAFVYAKDYNGRRGFQRTVAWYGDPSNSGRIMETIALALGATKPDRLVGLRITAPHQASGGWVWYGAQLHRADEVLPQHGRPIGSMQEELEELLDEAYESYPDHSDPNSPPVSPTTGPMKQRPPRPMNPSQWPLIEVTVYGTDPIY